MKPYREIKFIATRSNGDLNEGELCRQGHLDSKARGMVAIEERI